MNFLKSLLSRKLGVTAAIEVFIATLHTTADTKAMCMAAVAVAYVLAQCYVDAQTPPEESNAK